MSFTLGEYSRISTVHPPTWVGPVTVGEADATGVVGSVVLAVVVGTGAVACEEETTGIGVAVGCVLGVFRPAMTIPATTTATTTTAPMSAQAQPRERSRPAVAVVLA
ncbi:hypothetical protein [Actinobaculum sp. 313]|uniref:hypothetical protein n=1 Tax=Actinobaculum sp. 313 TaxID=2495645 RepID=UPI000F74428E|nr:hypothetical protein [Actinobaculum sp. 313]